MYDHLKDKWVVLKVQIKKDFVYDNPKFFYYNGKLKEVNNKHVIIDDVLHGIQAFRMDKIEKIRECNNRDMLRITAMLERQRIGNNMRKIDLALVRKVEKLKDIISKQKSGENSHEPR